MLKLASPTPGGADVLRLVMVETEACEYTRFYGNHQALTQEHVYVNVCLVYVFANDAFT